jgi:hypothetical protein
MMLVGHREARVDVVAVLEHFGLWELSQLWGFNRGICWSRVGK